MSAQLDIARDGDVNPGILSAQLQALLGDRFEALGVGDGMVTVYTTGKLNDDDSSAAQRLIEEHDAAEKTPAQQAQEQRAAARAAIGGEDFDTLKGAVAGSNLDTGTKAALTKLVDLIQALAIAGGYTAA